MISFQFFQKSEPEERPVTPTPTPEPDVEELPEEPIETIEVIEAAVEPPPSVPEEIKPPSSSEPTPKKTKSKKNKIKIEETEDVLEVDPAIPAAVTEPIVPIEENVVVVEEKKSKPKKNKKSKEDANGMHKYNHIYQHSGPEK